MPRSNSGTEYADRWSANVGQATRAKAPSGMQFEGRGASLDDAVRMVATCDKAGQDEMSRSLLRGTSVGRDLLSRPLDSSIISNLPAGPGRGELDRGRRRLPHARIMPDLPHARVRGTIGITRRAGLLTYGCDRSRAAFPRRSRRSGMWNSLGSRRIQQRPCAGFSPASLFVPPPERAEPVDIEKHILFFGVRPIDSPRLQVAHTTRRTA